MTASTVTGNTSKAIERHLSSSYQVVLYVAKNLDKITDLVNLMKYFDNFYVGAYTTPPSTTPSGEALTAGMFYLNLVDDHLYFWAQLDGVYAWYKMDTIATNVIAQFDAHAAGVTASFTQLAESYKATFLTYLGDTQTYRNQTEVMYQQVVLMHAAVINAYDQVLPVLEHIEAIEAVSNSITKVNTVADNIGSVNAVANNMPAVINAGTYVNQIANAVASTHADALATAADRTVTESNAVSTAADKVAVTAMRNEVEADRAEVANNTVTVAGQAAQVAADTVTTQTNRNEAVAAKDLAKRWATGNTPVGDTPSDVNNARYYSEVAKANANQTFKSGGLFTPTAGQEYPDVTGVSVDTVWLIKFPDAADSYLYGSGALAGQTVRNGYQLYYDTPANTFGVIATTLSGVQKVNGKNPNALGEITLTAEDLSDVYSTQEVDAALSQKAQDNAVVKLAGNQTIDGTKTFTAAVKGVKAVADEDLPTKAQMDVLASGMSQAQFEVIREQNKEKYAASGFVHMGKHYHAANSEYIAINEGLWTNTVAPNNLQLGKFSAPAPLGKSKSDAPVVHVAGTIFTLSMIGISADNQNQIKFPQAPDGKTTYNKATGATTTYATAAEAFNAQAADPTNVEVVINRVDMWGLEVWPEEVTLAKPFIYPNGLIQSKATQMSGVPTIGGSDRPESYYAMFNGDTTSKGTCVNFFTLTDAQKKKVLADPKNNLYFTDDGLLVQWRLRVKSFAGKGNGDWSLIETNIGNQKDGMTWQQWKYIAAQGQLDVSSEYGTVNAHIFLQYLHEESKHQVGVFSVGNDSPNGINSECYFLVCGTVNRLNQGAYHPSFNPSGAARFCSADGGTAVVWSNGLARTPATQKDCFVTPTTGYPFQNGFVYLDSGKINGVGGSGRPDGRYYDGIYASGQGGVCRDMRYSANGVDLVDFAEADQRVKYGTYRGFERLKFTRIIQTTLIETALFGGGQYFRFAGYQPWELFNKDSAVYFPRTNIIAYPCYIETRQGAATYLCMTPTHAQDEVLTSGLLQAFSPFVGEVNAGDIAYVMRCEDINVSVGGSFLQTDVIGNPSNIIATPALAQGWYGKWIGFKNELANVAVSRKNLLSNCLITYTRDNGASWATQSNYYFDFTNNEVQFIVAGDTVLVQYQAFAKQTESAVNTSAYGMNSGVGAVYAQSLYLPEWGCLLGESLCETIGKNTVAPEGTIQPLIRYVRNPLGELNMADVNVPKHAILDMVAVPNNNSPAYKALNYNVSINQQANIQYAYTQLKHNGTNWGDDGKVTIVDNQSVKTDLNGNKVLVGTVKLKEPFGWIKNKV